MSDWLFAPFQGLFMVVSLAVLAVKAYALVDAAVRPQASYRVADKQSKTFWLVLLAIAVLLSGMGLLGIAALVASIVYLVDVRPRLREVRGRGSSSSGPYGPW